MNRFAANLPAWIDTPLRQVKTFVTALPYAGKGRFCPVCSRSSSRFRPSGLIPREDAQCPYCGSLERHRFLWLYLLNETDLFDGRLKKVLHVAPEPALTSRLKQRLGPGYITADLLNPKAMVKMDITNIEFPNATFDVIYCSHVLEHVPDDRAALREFHRVLKEDGWAILLVPITAAKTIEDPSIVSPQERLRIYGQADHVRRYGPDYADRLCEAGFAVKIISVSDLVDHEQAVALGLTSASGDIYFCTKTAVAPSE